MLNKMEKDSQDRQYSRIDNGTFVSAFFTVVFEIFKTVITVGLLALLFRIFIIQPFIVEGKSMTPTLQNNDYLLIDKISYRFGEPKRGDVIVFRYPKDPRFNYIKRIIGLPNEKIKITDKQVVIYNDEHPHGTILHEDYILEPNGSRLISNRKLIEAEVPSNNYFVMGDNRLGSSDSRDWGLLPMENIIGRSYIRLFPVDSPKMMAAPSYN